MKLGYLGPKGTFSEQAAMMYAAKCPYDCEYEMFLNITDVISAVGDGIIDEGIVPLENSIEGTVTSTVDTYIRRGIVHKQRTYTECKPEPYGKKRGLPERCKKNNFTSAGIGTVQKIY